ncbi:MAG: hypothetical protein HOV94_38470 [Saccharothrix sp.]|nr:hypothetical protein [Saccharothrix sp.]
MARDAWVGVAAALAAVAAMAGVAAGGVLLLGAHHLGGPAGMTAALVALAVGGSVGLDAAPAGDLPFTVRGVVDVMPSGVSLAGAVVLGLLLAGRGRDGLPVRGAAAAVTFPAALAVVAWSARGTLSLPRLGGTSGARPACVESAPTGGGSFDVPGAAFSAGVGSTVLAAAVWVPVVVGVCWAASRFRVVGGVLKVSLWAMAALTVAGVLVGRVSGGAAVAGGVLLALPLVVFGVLSLGLGVPWSLRSDGALACVDAGLPSVPMWVTCAVLLGLGVVAALGVRGGGPWRRAVVGAAWLASVVGVGSVVLALLGRVSMGLGVHAFGFTFSVLEARLAADPVAAFGLGVVGGGVAGFAGGLLVDGFLRLASVSWPAWQDR